MIPTYIKHHQSISKYVFSNLHESTHPGLISDNMPYSQSKDSILNRDRSPLHAFSSFRPGFPTAASGENDNETCRLSIEIENQLCVTFPPKKKHVSLYQIDIDGCKVTVTFLPNRSYVQGLLSMFLWGMLTGSIYWKILKCLGVLF